MKTWLANCLWDALKIVSCRAHDFFFDPRRAALARMRDRERWWSYKIKAKATEDKRDDMRAEWFRVRFDFVTPPDKAKARGDLDPIARRMASDAMEMVFAGTNSSSPANRAGQGPAADRAKL